MVKNVINGEKEGRPDHHHLQVLIRHTPPTHPSPAHIREKPDPYFPHPNHYSHVTPRHVFSHVHDHDHEIMTS
jgi:hypothetical protein